MACRYKVSKNSHDGKRRIVTDKYWLKKSKAKEYAKKSNKYFKGGNARVIKFRRNK